MNWQAIMGLLQNKTSINTPCLRLAAFGVHPLNYLVNFLKRISSSNSPMLRSGKWWSHNQQVCPSVLPGLFYIYQPTRQIACWIPDNRIAWLICWSRIGTQRPSTLLLQLFRYEDLLIRNLNEATWVKPGSVCQWWGWWLYMFPMVCCAR